MMRAFFLSGCLLSAGCQALWGGGAVNDPRNCVVSPDACSASQICNTETEVCEDVLTEEPLRYPQTCRELATTKPDATDGSYTLYLGGDAARPWTAYCKDLGTQAPTEYLTLPATSPTNGNGNFAQYTAGGNAPGSDVRTIYQRVRLDPLRLLVDVSDRTYASSSGSLLHYRATLTAVPFATAHDCLAPDSATGLGRIDLTGTPFAVAPDAFERQGDSPGGAATYRAHDQVVTLTGGGLCGSLVPKLPPGGTATTFTLPLVYTTQTCSDGVQSGDELAPDCGGSCDPCPLLQPASWASTGPGTITITPSTDGTDGVAFGYMLSGSAVYTTQTWAFTTIAPRTQRLRLDWRYNAFHAYFAVTGSADAFAEGPSGPQSVSLYSGGSGGGWDATGSATLDVTAGYPFGFVITGSNFDSDARLIGTLTVTQR